MKIWIKKIATVFTKDKLANKINEITILIWSLVYCLSFKKKVVLLTISLLLYGTKVEAKSSLLSKLGISSNYNTPEVWQDQLGNYATGGSLYARTPMTDLQLVSFNMPSIDAGCGGININFGGFGYISGKQIQTLIKQIGANALSYTVMLTIKSISPQIADLLENLEAMARFMNSQNINSCQLGASIAAGLFPKNEHSHRLACQARKMGGNNGGIGDAMSNYFTARENCNDGQKAMDTNNEDKDGNKPLLPAEYNLVWYALKKEEANVGKPMSKQDKEFLMSLSGTIISVKKGESIGFIHKPSLISGDDKIIEKIVFGSGDSVIKPGQSSSFNLYECDNANNCLHPKKSTSGTRDFTIEDTMLYKVTKIILSLEKKVKQDADGADVSLDADEKHLISKSSLPILKLVTQYVALKGHGARYSVEDYAESLAFDYTIGYLDDLIDFVNEAVGNLEHAQMEGDVIRDFKNDIMAVRRKLFNERSTALSRLQTILSIKAETKQKENQVNLLFADYRDMRSK